MILAVESACSPLKGELIPPGDKSISHRALILACLASGQSRVEGLLDSEDVKATASACRQLGMTMDEDGETLVLGGVGTRGLSAPGAPLDMGNSGTAMRLLSGVLAAQPFQSELTGDSSLERRPMGRIVEPLSMMGASIETAPGGTPPLRIYGNPELRGIDYQSPIASAQVKSCLLLAGLYADGHTTVSEPLKSRDHTERIAAMVPRSELLLRNVGLNETRDGLIHVLEEMGADLSVLNRRRYGGEEVGDIRLRHTDGLRGIDIPPELVPSLIDELPVILALAAVSNGTTRIRGAAELRVKESDRIAVMARGLTNLGVSLVEYEDGIDVEGGKIRGGAVDGAGDHRCAMSFCILGQLAESEILVSGCENIATSYPGFMNDLLAAGGSIHAA
jgi:3-phosphoshikimate 1-carboxyvinyltransferase